MQHLFDASVYTSRRQGLASRLGSGKVVLAGNHHSPINYAGNPYRYRQDSNFLYYAGLDLPKLNVVIDIDSGVTTLYGKEQSVEDAIWTGPTEPLKDLAARVGITSVKPPEALFTDCQNVALHCLPPYRHEHFKLYQLLTEQADCSVSASPELIHTVIGQREIKEDVEVVEIERALDITAQMHRKVMKSVRSGMKESVLAGIASGIASANEVCPAYGIILTRDGHVLHHHSHHNTLEEGDIVLGDFGAESLMRYSADITRTFPVGKTFTPRQRDLYEICLEAQLKAINAVRPGQLFRDVHLLSARIIADGLRSLGLMKGDPDEAVTAGAHALFFPHGLGHMIGLDTHDMEGLGEDFVGYDAEVRRSDQFGLGYLRMAKKLKPGHVVTVEPGIYFIPVLIDQWKGEGRHSEFIDYSVVEKFRDAKGIRIEDDVLVTDSGNKVLGPGIPKSVKEIEALRKK
jgi:Xaa-Pro aminopeptidase